jgi:outer membrane protein OmpA-like peptidoglycan-associated protein
MLMRLLGVIIVFAVLGCKSLSMNQQTSEAIPPGPPPYTLTSLAPLKNQDFQMISPEELAPDVRNNDLIQEKVQLEPFPTVYFSFDSWEVAPEVQGRLDATADWMNRFPGYELTIEGHTDIRGTESYNMILGVRRAKAIKEFLANLGIPRKRMEIVSYGKTLVLCEVDDEHVCHQFNRRADLLLE